MISKYINAGGFGLIIICFLFPFISIKCNEQTLVKVKGYELITGKNDLLGDKGNMFGNKKGKQEESGTPFSMDDDESANQENEGDDNAIKKEDKKNDIKPNVFMILLLARSLIGGVTLLTVKDKINKIGLGFAIGALLVLIAEVAMLEMQISDAGGGKNEMFTLVIKIGYEIGFWLMLITLIGLIAYNIAVLVKKPAIEPIAPSPSGQE